MMTKTTSLLLAALLGAAAVSAQAGELYSPVQYQDPASSLSRSQVKQSVLQARKAGELNHDDVDLPDDQAAVPFGKTRAQVKGETLAARATGGLDHNDVDLPNVAKGSVRSREEVRAQAIATRQLVKKAPGSNTIDY